jgi:hypothetical protein
VRTAGPRANPDALVHIHLLRTADVVHFGKYLTYAPETKAVLGQQPAPSVKPRNSLPTDLCTSNVRAVRCMWAWVSSTV